MINVIINISILILLIICAFVLWISIKKDGGPYNDEDDWPHRKF
jgi:hypothetical protein